MLTKASWELAESKSIIQTFNWFICYIHNNETLSSAFAEYVTVFTVLQAYSTPAGQASGEKFSLPINIYIYIYIVQLLSLLLKKKILIYICCFWVLFPFSDLYIIIFPVTFWIHNHCSWSFSGFIIIVSDHVPDLSLSLIMFRIHYHCSWSFSGIIFTVPSHVPDIRYDWSCFLFILVGYSL